MLVTVPICLFVVAIVVAQLGKAGAVVSLAIYGLIPVLYFLTIIFTPPEVRLIEKHRSRPAPPTRAMNRTPTRVPTGRRREAVMLKEFREFIAKGNLVEIAVAFIMGLAFAAVVTAFTAMVLGAIAYVFGSTNGIEGIGVHKGTTLVIPVGSFILAVINFLIVAVVLFLVVKAYNRFKKKKEEAAPTEVELLTQIRDELARQ